MYSYQRHLNAVLVWALLSTLLLVEPESAVARGRIHSACARMHMHQQVPVPSCVGAILYPLISIASQGAPLLLLSDSDVVNNRPVCSPVSSSCLLLWLSRQDACNSNASFDLTTDQLLSGISEMEKAKEIVKVGWGALGPGLCERLVYCLAQLARHVAVTHVWMIDKTQCWADSPPAAVSQAVCSDPATIGACSPTSPVAEHSTSSPRHPSARLRTPPHPSPCLLFLPQDNISSGRASEGMLMLQQLHQNAAAAAVAGGDQAELLDRLDCGVKILSGKPRFGS